MVIPVWRILRALYEKTINFQHLPMSKQLDRNSRWRAIAKQNVRPYPFLFCFGLGWFMVLNAIFNNISVISWRLA